MEDDNAFLSKMDFDAFDLVSDQFEDQPMDQQPVAQPEMVQPQQQQLVVGQEQQFIQQSAIPEFQSAIFDVVQPQNPIVQQVMQPQIIQQPQQQQIVTQQIAQPLQQQLVQPQVVQQGQVVQPQPQIVQQQQVLLPGTMMNVNGQQYVVSSTNGATGVVQTIVSSSNASTIPVATPSTQQAIIVTSTPSATPSTEQPATTSPKRRTTILVKAQYVQPQQQSVQSQQQTVQPQQQTAEERKPKGRGRGATANAGKGGAKKKKDPNAPVAALTAYKFFYKETAQTVRNHNPGVKFGDVSRVVASMWESMADSDKEKYRAMAVEDKERYAREINEYNSRKEDPPVDSVVFSRTSSTLSVVKLENNEVDPADITDSTCIRDGCTFKAVRNQEWEGEYCSNDCVVQHCKDVFRSFTANSVAEETAA